MNHKRAITRLLPALLLFALAIPSAASAQATRTWVSGVGDDANPCSRTAPCKTFAGAISKTANGGEINVLDPGGFGGVTITKSITLKAQGDLGGMLVSGTNAIIINAQPTDKVNIVGLDINGSGIAQTSLNAIKVISAGRVNIVNNDIYKFKAAININPTSSQTRVVVKNNDIHDNGIGLINSPGNNLISFTTAVLRHNDFQDNVCGVVTSSFGANSSTPVAATDCGAATSASGIARPADTRIYNNGINLNGFGVFARGGQATAEISNNDITNNDSFGLRRLDSATIRTVSPANNVISGNGASDAPNGTPTTLTKRSR